MEDYNYKNKITTIPETVWTSALKGEADSQVKLASIYKKQGNMYDDRQFMYWCTKAAEQGHAEAQYLLGMFLSDVCISFVNQFEAAIGFELINKAAEQGHPDAQFELSRCYNLGHGADENSAIAKEWLKKAAENGNREAQSILDLVKWFENGEFEEAVDDVKI